MNSKKKLFNIYKFNKYKEGNRREVKTAEEKIPADLWRTYSAFANTNGGVIILGVKERKDGSWTVTGIKDPVKYEKDFWNQIHSNKVSINLLNEEDVEFYTYDNKDIMVIYVPRASIRNRPVFLNDDVYHETYRRNGDGDYHCTKSEIHAMIRDSNEESVDSTVLLNMPISVLSNETINAYRNHFRYHKLNHVWNKLSDEEFLERLGAIQFTEEDNKYHPTIAGLLMFAEEYKIRYEFPRYFLDYKEMLDVKYRWADRIESSTGTWSGNVFDFYMKVVNKLTADIKVPFHLEGITRIDETPVHKAIREALVNCLTNVDFYLPMGVVINKYEDKIVMENPGTIRTGKDQMIKGGKSNPRNEVIMKMFNRIGIGEKAGSGVPSIFDVWEEQGWKVPTVVEEFGPDRTILTLEFANSFMPIIQKIITEKNIEVSEITLNQFNDILDYLRDGGESSVTEISKSISLAASRVRKLMNKMVDLGLVEEIGINKSRKFKLNGKILQETIDKKVSTKVSEKNSNSDFSTEKNSKIYDNNATFYVNEQMKTKDTINEKTSIKSVGKIKPSIKNVDKKPSIKDENKKKIIAYLTDHALAKSSEIAEDIGLQQSYTRNYLRELVKEDIVAIEGTNKNRRYKLKG